MELRTFDYILSPLAMEIWSVDRIWKRYIKHVNELRSYPCLLIADIKYRLEDNKQMYGTLGIEISPLIVAEDLTAEEYEQIVDGWYKKGHK